jgi:hypothetical protein
MKVGGRGRFTPGKDPVPIVQEAEWGPGLVAILTVLSRHTNWHSLSLKRSTSCVYFMSHCC